MKNEKRIITAAASKRDACIQLGISPNGLGYKKIESLMILYNISEDIFDGRNKNRLYPGISKECPVCSKEFKTQKGSDKEKIVCSHACANAHFRSLDNHPNWKDISEYDAHHPKYSEKYRIICFGLHGHEHKCSVCEETRVLDVHHYDEDRRNNKVENLIPLCPTHHRLIHTKKYNKAIQGDVDEYVGRFLERLMRSGVVG